MPNKPNLKSWLAISAFLILLTTPMTTAERTIYVDDDGPADFNNIHAAIKDASAGDTIVVADGRYTGDGNRNMHLDGKDITIRSQNGPDGCIIDCNGMEIEPHRSFYLRANCVIVGFTITNGYADKGGAIYCEHDSPTVINCVLSNNSAQREGGAIYCEHGSPTVINCVLSNNSAQREGGAIFCHHSSPIITNCTITNNSAGCCGGVYCERANLSMTNSTINENSVAGNVGPFAGGGGIYCRWDSRVTLQNCKINENTAEGDSEARGGGICCLDNSSLTINDSEIRGNTARSNHIGIGGGILCSHDSGLTISGSIISANIAEGKRCLGGGIYYYLDLHYDTKFMLTNSTICGNLTKTEMHDDQDYGGGIFCLSGRPILTKCKISGNSASKGAGIACESNRPIIAGCIISGNFRLNTQQFGGGGIYCTNSSPNISNCTIIGNSFFGLYCRGGSTTVENSILYYNGNGKGHLQQIVDYGLVKVIYSDVQTYKPSNYPWPGEGNTNADPCFAESGYWDINSVWIEGDYHLLPDSRCIDAGGPTSYLLGSMDLDGRPRVICGRIDMGAYEFNHIPVAYAGPDQTVCLWMNETAEVTLDGTGSYDEDGQPLTYLWNWTVDGSSFTATEPNITIEFPVGEHTIELVVNDGIDDSDQDEVIITVVEPMESQLWILPRTINRDSGNKYILAWVRLPEGITKEQVKSDEPLLLYPGGIEAMRQYVFEHGRRDIRRTAIFASFDKAKLMGAVPDNGSVELGVVGLLKTGEYFYGTDTIRIIARRRQPCPNRPDMKR